MKKFFLYTFSILGLLMGMAACQKIAESDDVPHTQSTRIMVQDTLVRVPATAGTAQNIVIITGEFTEWSAASNDSWISVSKTEVNEHGKPEQAVVITFQANTYYSRYGSITLTLDGTDHRRTFRVLQESALGDPFINIGSNAQLNVSANALDTVLTVETNQNDYTVSTNATWIRFDKTATNLTVKIAENETLSSRLDSFVVVAGTAPYQATRIVRIRQARPDTENEITINGIEFVKVPAGEFYMGAQKDDPGGRNYYASAAANQGPVHKVTISNDFYISKYEVTQAQYTDVIGSNPSSTIGANHPVEMVSWSNAVTFTNRLSQNLGLTFRLPTEAEWEYAARGGSESPYYIYSGSNISTDVAYHWGNPGPERDLAVTKPVGSYLPNYLGIYDMSGNVYEWVLDKFEDYTASDKVDPVKAGLPGVTNNFILRGGSWYHNAASQAVSYRGTNVDEFLRAYLGFRIVYIPEN